MDIAGVMIGIMLINLHAKDSGNLNKSVYSIQHYVIKFVSD